MSLFISLILFFTQALIPSVGGGEWLQIHPLADSIESNDQEQPFHTLLHSETGTEDHDLGFFENVEEEEKPESEVEHPSGGSQIDFSRLLKFFAGDSANSLYTTKSLATHIPLYTLFHSWKSCLA